MARPMVKIPVSDIIKTLEPVLKKMDRDIAEYNNAKKKYPALLKAWKAKAEKHILTKGVVRGTCNVETYYYNNKSERGVFLSLKVSLRALEKAIGKMPLEPVDPKLDIEYYRKGKMIPAKREVLYNALTVYKMADKKTLVNVPVNAEWSEYLQY